MSPASHSKSLQSGDPRLMVQWARRYAKSRTVSFLVQWIFIVIMVLVVAMAATLTNSAYQQGNLILTYVSVAFMCVVMLLLMWFSMSRWGGELIFRITQWFYGREGYVSYDEEYGAAPRSPWLMTALGGGLVGYHLLGAMLVSLNYISLRNMQPFSAIYMVPFLCYMTWAQGLGLWAWVWPLLYGLHGLLLFTGVFPQLPPNYTFLHMIVPVFGYGLIAILLGHMYSRYALWRLKRLARAGLDTSSSAEEGGDETR